MQHRKANARVVALVLPVIALTACWPSTQAAEPMATLKERLSDKASDNQRVDNCRVAIERRGPKPRPDCKSAARKK
jgi:hypothetical protein